MKGALLIVLYRQSSQHPILLTSQTSRSAGSTPTGSGAITLWDWLVQQGILVATTDAISLKTRYIKAFILTPATDHMLWCCLSGYQYLCHFSLLIFFEIFKILNKERLHVCWLVGTLSTVLAWTWPWRWKGCALKTSSPAPPATLTSPRSLPSHFRPQAHPPPRLPSIRKCGNKQWTCSHFTVSGLVMVRNVVIVIVMTRGDFVII